MNEETKEEVRQLLNRLRKIVEDSNNCDKFYIILLIEKLYPVLKLNHVKIDHFESMDEWLEIMAWAELHSILDFADIKPASDENLLHLKELQEDIRDGFYREDIKKKQLKILMKNEKMNKIH